MQECQRNKQHIIMTQPQTSFEPARINPTRIDISTLKKTRRLERRIKKLKEPKRFGFLSNWLFSKRSMTELHELYRNLHECDTYFKIRCECILVELDCTRRKQSGTWLEFFKDILKNQDFLRGRIVVTDEFF